MEAAAGRSCPTSQAQRAARPRYSLVASAPRVDCVVDRCPCLVLVLFLFLHASHDSIALTHCQYVSRCEEGTFHLRFGFVILRSAIFGEALFHGGRCSGQLLRIPSLHEADELPLVTSPVEISVHREAPAARTRTPPSQQSLGALVKAVIHLYSLQREAELQLQQITSDFYSSRRERWFEIAARCDLPPKPRANDAPSPRGTRSFSNQEAAFHRAYCMN